MSLGGKPPIPVAKLNIDNKTVEVPEGTTVLQAARQAGIEIPALCQCEGLPHQTSCLVCLVKRRDNGRFLPSCATVVTDGLDIESETEEVHQARRQALQLLIDDHLGDCLGPCEVACPASLNVPVMLRQVAQGRWREAVVTVKQTLALPAVLGRICPAPCEGACRRNQMDDAVAIRQTHGLVAEMNNADGRPFIPRKEEPTGKSVAIVGAGPAGLAAAYYLLQKGHACTIIEKSDVAGGGLRQVEADKLPPAVIEAELKPIMQLGAQMRYNTALGTDVTLDQLKNEFDAVFVAVGKVDEATAQKLGLPAGKRGLTADNTTPATPVDGVFAGGDAVRPVARCVMACADGATAAVAIDQMLRGEKVVGRPRPFNVRIGKLSDEEKPVSMSQATTGGRVQSEKDKPLGEKPAMVEAQRCLHCDCRKPHTCKLRIWSDLYGVKASGTSDRPRRTLRLDLSHPEVVYEPGKCIGCGICIEINRRSDDPVGLTFLGRGFEVRMSASPGHNLAESLTKDVRRTVEACPTGALSLRDESSEA